MATVEQIKAAADEIRREFMANTIRLDLRQLLTQLETLGECRAEDESREGRAVTDCCISYVQAVGGFRYPNIWAEAVRDHFVGESA